MRVWMCDLMDALMCLFLRSLQFAVWINPQTLEKKKRKEKFGITRMLSHHWEFKLHCSSTWIWQRMGFLSSSSVIFLVCGGSCPTQIGYATLKTDNRQATVVKDYAACNLTCKPPSTSGAHNLKDRSGPLTATSLKLTEAMDDIKQEVSIMHDEELLQLHL